MRKEEIMARKLHEEDRMVSIRQISATKAGLAEQLLSSTFVVVERRCDISFWLSALRKIYIYIAFFELRNGIGIFF